MVSNVSLFTMLPNDIIQMFYKYIHHRYLHTTFTELFSILRWDAYDNVYTYITGGTGPLFNFRDYNRILSHWTQLHYVDPCTIIKNGKIICRLSGYSLPNNY